MRALLIASAETSYEPTLPQIKGAELDAWAIRDVLTDFEVGLFSRENVKVLQNVTSSVVLEELADLAQTCLSDDMVLVYFSGHGLIDRVTGNFYWVTANTTRTDLDGTAVSAEKVHGILDACASQAIVIILDCCHGGAYGHAAPPDQYGGYGRFVITSSAAGGNAVDLVDIMSRMSVFTKHVVDGLSGYAEDRDRDGYIDVIDLFDYVASAMVAGDLPAPIQRFEGRLAVPIARHARPAIAEASWARSPAAGLSVLETDVTCATPLTDGLAVVAIYGSVQRKLRILPGGSAISIPSDHERISSFGRVIATWSDSSVAMFTERLEPLTSYAAADGYRIADVLTCSVCAWVFEVGMKKHSFPLAPHIEREFRCVIIGRDGVSLPIHFGRIAEWPGTTIRYIHEGFSANRAGDSAGRHVHVLIQRAHRWFRVPIQEHITIGHSGIRERDTLGLAAPDIFAISCHEDGEIGAIEVAVDELLFRQSREVLHRVRADKWEPFLIPHPTGVLALFASSSDDGHGWTLWRSAHDNSSGRLHVSSGEYLRGAYFGSTVSVTERNQSGGMRAVLVSLRRASLRTVDLKDLGIAALGENVYPIILAESREGYVVYVQSTEQSPVIGLLRTSEA
ncbi:caspase domain-containing protein [Streptomyces mirabilis]|uniref:caspase family protein n=1 Tax=Streptomyces mirabilis TaxID=68239 RepID=UPI0036C0E38E